MMRRNSRGAMTRPEGFDGELMMMRRVRGVIERSTASAVSWKPVSSVSMKTGVASAKTAISGNVTQ